MNLKTVGVVGLGLLGRGIAACLLGHGFRVVACARRQATHDEARAYIERAIRDLVQHAGFAPELIDASVASGAKGIVIAGVGNGNMTKPGLDALAAQAKKGVVCVRASRVATGQVGRNVEVDDDKLGLVASDDLNPQKARVLLRLALLKPRSLAEMQRLFVEY